MATKTRRLWTAFLGGSAVLGVGLINLQGLRKRKLLFDEGLCESGDNNKPELSAKDGDTDYLTNKQVRERSVLLEKARSLVQRVKEEKGCPGLSISVSVNGRTVWSEGFGYSDLENDVPCKPTTVMRIASISKPLTATAIMELLEKGKLNLDDPVQKYVTSFPVKQVNSKECTITIRHLLSHLSGIRHYYEKEESKNMNANESKDDAKKKTKSEFERPEYYIKECYDTVEKSLSLFKDDPLVHEPGTDYLYTTYGWTLLSAVVESAAEQDFLKYMDGLFERLDMTQTQTQLHGKLIYGRARFYVRDSKGRLKNTPYVDNCYKLAGGGLLSTSEDLIKFGNAMLYSSQVGKYRKISKKALLPGILSPKSMAILWEIVKKTEGKVCKKGGYGLGWMIFPNKHEHGCCKDQQKAIFHTGGAVGASSVLLILPQVMENVEQCSLEEIVPPRGVVVAILTNLGEVQLSQTALEIAELFMNYKER